MNYFDTLPIELLHEIADKSEPAYQAMLAYPRFARATTYDMRLDYRVRFGHDVCIDKDEIIWTRNGTPHRLDGPAKQSVDCGNLWYRNGELHRDNAPAVIDVGGGALEWYRNGKIHRDDGPARIENHGTFLIQWYRNDKLHRIGGPASVNVFYDIEFYMVWYRDGVIHRDDGPAVVNTECDSVCWYHNGKIHRDGDGPAAQRNKRRVPERLEWYQDDVLHREDGPAVIYMDGRMGFFQKGEEYAATPDTVFYTDCKKYRDEIRNIVAENEKICRSDILQYRDALSAYQ